MIEIRQAAPADIDTARAIMAEYMASVSHVAGESFAHQRVDEELRTLPGRYGPPGGAILLVWDETTCVGCVAIRPLDGATCELKRTYIRASHRGLGLGRRLCEAALDRARELGYGAMKLDSDPALTAAIALYRVLGFVDTPRYNDDPDPATVYLTRAL